MMRWVIVVLALAVVGLGVWLVVGLRAPARPVGEQPRVPTVSAPPERATREPPANANANVNANVPPGHAAPPPPERLPERTPRAR